MLSRLANPSFHHLRNVSVPSSTKSALAASLLARHLVTSAAKSARTAGLRGSTIREAFQTKAGPTLRERLLGPTTGKPFIYGTYAVCGASALGIGALCFYGLGMSKELSAVDRSAMWPQYVRDRLHATYGYLAGSLALTAGAGYAASRSPAIMSLAGRGTLPTMLVSIALLIGTGTLARAVSYENTTAKHLAWALHTGVLGAILAPMVALGGPALMRAAWYTAGIVAGLSATAICAPSDKFLNMAGPLAMGLGVVFVANIGSFFFPMNSALGAGLAAVVVYGGLILFSAFLLYDTQKILRMAETMPDSRSHSFVNQYGQNVRLAGAPDAYDPINAQMSLYMDIVNIFIRMAMIMGGGGQRRK